MTLQLDTTYRNRSSVNGVDHAGRIFLDHVRCQVASGRWQRKYQGDGLAAFSSGTSDIFTANTNGYSTSGAWNTGGANSISNARAYVVIQEMVGGVATGRELLLQRGSQTTAGTDRSVVVVFAWEPFTGTPDATTAPSAPARSIAFDGIAPNGVGSNIFAHLGSSPQMGGTGGTIVSNHWICDAPSGTTEDVCPFWLEVYDATNGQPAFCLGYEALYDAPVGDDHPCVFSIPLDSGTQWEFGEDLTTVPKSHSSAFFTFYSTSPIDGVAVVSCSLLRWQMPDSSSSGHPAFADLVATTVDGSAEIYPAFMFALTGSGAARKGTCESLEQHFPNNVSQLWPATTHALVADAVEPPRKSLGHALIPWELNVTQDGLSPTNHTNFVRLASTAPAPDATAPTITFNQAAGPIAYNATLTVDITDNLDELGTYGVFLQYADQPDEYVWDGHALSTDYDLASGATAIANGVRFSVKRDAGFPAGFTLKVVATDLDGNVQTATRAYTISTSPNPAAADTTPPTVTLVTPTTGRLAKFTPVVADIGDDRALRAYELWAFWENETIPAELVYSSVKPSQATLYTVSVAIVAGKDRVTLVRKSGWERAPRLKTLAVDTSGNLAV